MQTRGAIARAPGSPRPAPPTGGQGAPKRRKPGGSAGGGSPGSGSGGDSGDPEIATGAREEGAPRRRRAGATPTTPHSAKIEDDDEGAPPSTPKKKEAAGSGRPAPPRLAAGDGLGPGGGSFSPQEVARLRGARAYGTAAPGLPRVHVMTSGYSYDVWHEGAPGAWPDALYPAGGGDELEVYGQSFNAVGTCTRA